jgi:polyhydroxyalkanoate synthesis regulator phasin
MINHLNNIILKWRKKSIMRYLIASTWMFVLLLIPGMASAASADASSPVEMDILLNLLRNKGLITAEESTAIGQRPGSGTVSRSDIKAVIELLRSKGSISDQDAANFFQKLTAKPLKEEKVAAPAPEKNEPAEKKEPDIVPAVPPVDEDMTKATLNMILVKQGVLGADEAEQISERIGRKWTKADENEIIADPDMEIEYHRTTLPKEGLLADVDQLVLQGFVAKDEAERIKARFLRKLSLERVTDDIGANLRQDLHNQVEERIVPVPEWTRRFKLGGDIRLRYEGDFFGNNNADFENPSNTSTLFNSQVNQQRFQIRARLAVTAQVNDQVEAGIGLATVSGSEPQVSNTTNFGDFFNNQSFMLNLAYLKWTPSPMVTVWGGRFPSPWFYSDLVWSPSLNFDGMALSLTPRITSNIDLFLTGGAFPVEQYNFTSHNKWLYAGQVGMRFQNKEKLTAKMAVAYYFFDNMTGIANSPSNPSAYNWTAPEFQQKGNTLFDISTTSTIVTAYASKFHELDAIGTLDLGYWDPVRVVLLADYVNNLGFNQSIVNALTGTYVQKETEGYQFGVTIGYPQTVAFGQWNTYLFYKHLESDAVVDAFADPDFHLGGTNAKGWQTAINFGLYKNTWMTARWLSANEISGPPLSIDVFQLDINARF